MISKKDYENQAVIEQDKEVFIQYALNKGVLNKLNGLKVKNKE